MKAKTIILIVAILVILGLLIWSFARTGDNVSDDTTGGGTISGGSLTEANNLISDSIAGENDDIGDLGDLI